MSPYAKCMTWLGVALVLVAGADVVTSTGVRLPLFLVGVPFLACLAVAGHYRRRIDR